MKRPKGFSLIEMLIVLSIILILLVVFQNLFVPKNKQIYEGQKCVNDVYAFINTFLNAGLSSKGFDSGGTMIYPSDYIISLNYTGNKVSNNINGSTERRTANLSGTNSMCYINGIYNVILTGNLGNIVITKGTNNSQFTVSYGTDRSGVTAGTQANTAIAQLLLCKNNTGCIHIGEYIADKRNQTITKRVCLGFSGTDCTQWNQ